MTDLADPLDHLLAARARIERQLAHFEARARRGQLTQPRLRVIQFVADLLEEQRRTAEAADDILRPRGDARETA